MCELRLAHALRGGALTVVGRSRAPAVRNCGPEAGSLGRAHGGPEPGSFGRAHGGPEPEVWPDQRKFRTLHQWNISAVIAFEEAVVQIVEVGVDGDPLGFFLEDDAVEAGVPQSGIEGGTLHQVEHVDRV